MPLSLWGDHDSLDNPLGHPKRRQLPAPRAFSVDWKMPGGMLVPILSEAALLSEAMWMQLTGVDCGQNLNGLQGLRVISLGHFNLATGYATGAFAQEVF